MKSFFKGIIKLAVYACAAYGAYELYLKYGKNQKTEEGFDDLKDVEFGYDDEAVKETSFAQKIKDAAEKQLAKIR